MEAENVTTVDRLSDLPTSLIIDIISRLPVETAAASSAVSTRFRRLWTEITSITTSDAKETSLLVHILRQLTSPKLRLLHVVCGGGSDGGAADEFQERFIDFIHSRGVEVLFFQRVVGVVYRGNNVRKSLVTAKIFQCNSLVDLELGEFCDGGVFDKFNLPNLKRLDFEVNDEMCRKISFPDLFRSCVLLKILCMRMTLHDDHHVVEISCPNLESLVIIMWLPSKSEFTINAPNLRDISIQDFISSYKFATSGSVPAPLVAAEVVAGIAECVHDVVNTHDMVLLVDDMLSSIVRWISKSAMMLRELSVVGVERGGNGVKLIGSILSCAPMLEQVDVETRVELGFTRWDKSRFREELLEIRRSSPKCIIHVK